MAVLGQIRKRSFFLILVIGMALFAFVIADVFNRAGPNSSSDDPIGVVNEIDMDLNYFRSLVEQTERNYNLSTMESVSNVWDQLVKSTIFNQQFKYLGIDAGKEQIEMMLSQNESITNDPRFQNSSGIFDFGLFVNFLANKASLSYIFFLFNFRSLNKALLTISILSCIITLILE